MMGAQHVNLLSDGYLQSFTVCQQDFSAVAEEQLFLFLNFSVVTGSYEKHLVQTDYT